MTKKKQFKVHIIKKSSSFSIFIDLYCGFLYFISGAENRLKADFNETAADLLADNITSPKFAVKQSVTKTLKTAAKCKKDTPVTNITDQFTIPEETKLPGDIKVYSTGIILIV